MAGAGYACVLVLLKQEYISAGIIALLGVGVWHGSRPARATYRDILAE